MTVQKDAKKGKIYYGWFVLAAALAVTTISLIPKSSFSIFYPEILKEFGWSRAGTAGALSLAIIVFGVVSPFIGALVDRFGPRGVLLIASIFSVTGILIMSQIQNIWLFYLSYGVITAIGTNALGTNVHNTYLANWFARKRGLAFGIFFTHMGIAPFLSGQAQYLISEFGWRISYLIIAATVLVISVPLAALVIRRTPQEIGLLADGETASNPKNEQALTRNSQSLIIDRKWTETDWTLARAFKTFRFWAMFFSLAGFCMTLNLINAHQPAYCRDLGYSAAFAANILSLSGISMIFGSLASSMSDKTGREAALTAGLCGVVAAVFSLLSAPVVGQWAFYVYAISWGFFFGLIPSILIAGCADLFSGKHYGAIVGFLIMGWGLGGGIGPWFGGYIFDTTGSYATAFVTMIAAATIASGFFWLSAPRKVRLVPGKAPKTVEETA